MCVNACVCSEGNARQYNSTPLAKTFLGQGNCHFSTWLPLGKLLWITGIDPTGFWARVQLNGKSHFSKVSFFVLYVHLFIL